VISWDGPRIGLLSAGRRRQRVALVAPVLSSRRRLGLYGTSPSGAVRLVAAWCAHRRNSRRARQPLPIRTDGPFDAL
jgi:hypothetical protein